MAFSEAQYKNFIKVIVVAAVVKEFRKSAIMERIYRNIKEQNLVATGELLTFRLTKSIVPSRTDRFFAEGSDIVIKTAKIGPNKTPVAVEIKVKMRYGLNEEKYFYLTKDSPNKKWFPNLGNIAEWVRVKKQRGNSFTITKNGIQREANKDWEIKSVAFLVARKIARKGLDKKDFLEPFENKTYGVEASLTRAYKKIEERLFDLYGTTFLDIEEDLISNLL